MRATSEAPDRTIVDVARSGYAVGDRVLRPAQVIVARAAAAGELMAVAFRDYYEALGVPRDASDGGHPPRLPQAGARVPPGRQQGARRRGPLQGDLRGLRGPARSGEARSATTGSARTGGPARTCRARAGFERFARPAAASATCAATFGEFGDGDFSDFFEGLFGGGGAARRRGGGFDGFATRGADQEAVLELSLEEAARGRPAPISLGDGRDFEVDIPPGVRDGQRIRLAGEGGAGAGGGPPGDLFLRVRLRPHPRFRVRRPRPLHRPAGRAVGGGARRRRSRCRRSTAPRACKVPPGLLLRPQAAAARPGLPGPGGGTATSTPWSRSWSPRSSPTKERELFEQLAEVVELRPAEGARDDRHAQPASVTLVRRSPARRALDRHRGARRARPGCIPTLVRRFVELGLLEPRRRHAAAPRFPRDAPRCSPAPRACGATSASATPAPCSRASCSRASTNWKRSCAARARDDAEVIAWTRTG